MRKTGRLSVIFALGALIVPSEALAQMPGESDPQGRSQYRNSHLPPGVIICAAASDMCAWRRKPGGEGWFGFERRPRSGRSRPQLR